MKKNYLLELEKATKELLETAERGENVKAESIYSLTIVKLLCSINNKLDDQNLLKKKMG